MKSALRLAVRIGAAASTAVCVGACDRTTGSPSSVEQATEVRSARPAPPPTVAPSLPSPDAGQTLAAGAAAPPRPIAPSSASPSAADANLAELRGHPCHCGKTCHCGHCSGAVPGCHCHVKRADGKD